MPPLSRDLRQVLDRTVVRARGAAEDAARAGLATLAVDRDKPFDNLSERSRALRRALRAKERQLGGYEALVSEVAYQHWHRMLFTRFLAENELLMHPKVGVPVSLKEVSDLAREEGEADPWVLAARYATSMLPAIFREGDPELELRFAPEGRKPLEELLASLPAAVFTSDDGLGWVYQFWQSEKKKEVNKAGNKIGAAELPAVTQLFTEDYMVRFLLENSLGAWWAGRHPDSPLLQRFTYLRFTEEGTPAAGTFDGWPQTAAQVTVMDPCCGSGHFLTAAFEMLTAMRMEEEGLSALEAGDAVIEQNLFGLEIDPRCTQIAALALALAAWRSGGHRELPLPNIACSGIGVAGHLADWKNLATGDQALESALTALHEQFRNAPELGSLIDPRRATEEGHLFSVDYDKVAPLLEELLTHEEDPETQVAGWAATGIARAASLLARTYTLVATNVPYLNWQKATLTLREYLSRHFSDAKSDLSTAFLDRCQSMAADLCGWALVLPQGWLYLAGFARMRRRLLETSEWNLLAKLGAGAFQEIGGHVVNTCLFLGSARMVPPGGHIRCVDVSAASLPQQKADALREVILLAVDQASQLGNPDSRIVLSGAETHPLLQQYADSYEGIGAGDLVRFSRRFWELAELSKDWELLRSTTDVNGSSTGLHSVLLWEKGRGQLYELAMTLRARLKNTWRRGSQAWGKDGIAVNRMGDLHADRYRGEIFDSNIAAIIPKNPELLTAVWSFVISDVFKSAVKRIDQSMKVTNLTFLKVPFDLEHWTKVAENLYPDGLPEPYSNDPSQWLFKGDPADSTEPLQVAVARLLGYRWPDQEADGLDELADSDGAVPIPALAGEPSVAERLRVLLEHAWGDAWSPAKLAELLSQAGASGRDLETWLRDQFFAFHAKLFHNRPFIWHIWDGRKDGFGVLVNYHRLDRQLLDRIAHTLLGSWIEVQRDHVRRELPGAEARLVAAEGLQDKLELIAKGAPPYDIYVRWKDLGEQPIGWDPDLNDGVRLNIRPFVTAGVLRSKFTINWNKDRGKDPDGSERLNDLHYSRAQKQAARERATQ